MKTGIIKIYVLVLFGLLLLSNCSQRTKIGFLMDESQSGRWVNDKAMFIEKVEELGGQAIVLASEGDAEAQIKLANELLAQNIDILVIIPSDLYTAAEIVKKAHAFKIPVVSYDRIIRNCNVDFYISFDNVQVGELQANYLITACPQGKYAILGGAVTDNNSFLFRLGQLNVLQPLVERGDIEIVFDQYVDAWKPEEGYRLMKECLEKDKDIAAVVATNDQLANGAIQALKENNLDGEVCVSGQDADLDACQRIIAGTQSMTVYKPIEALAAKAAEIAMTIVDEEKLPTTYLSVNNGAKQVPSLLLPPMVVSKETINLTVVADGYFEEQKLKD